VRVIEGSDLAPVERALAGRTLAKLGDHRPHLTDVDAMQFCFAPAGPFMMGSEATDKEAAPDETPVHEVVIDHDFWIGRFPVTQAQYAAFIQDGGYINEEFWPEASAAGFWKGGLVKGRLDKEATRGPEPYAQPFSLPNHPIVGVSWYEARAYCLWLTQRWHTRLPEGWVIQLPSEAEWEKAARGGIEVPRDEIVAAIGSQFRQAPLKWNDFPCRQFPWGIQGVARLGNTRETGIDAPSTPGCFHSGRSPYGVEDLCGNVWEWTRSLRGEYPYVATDGREMPGNAGARVLRGGSWLHDRVFARCANRFRNYPFNRDDHLGFRVCLSSPISGSSGHFAWRCAPSRVDR
jgi:formylglycine-generating enzyme required for sulfatase activity